MLVFFFRRRKFINKWTDYNTMDTIPWCTFLSRIIVTDLSQSMTSMSQMGPTPNQILRPQATKENLESLDNVA